MIYLALINMIFFALLTQFAFKVPVTISVPVKVNGH